MVRSSARTGRPKDAVFLQRKALLELLSITRYYTDSWGAYRRPRKADAHQPGWPDSGTSMRDMVDNARKIVLTVQIPVFADADTGNGDAINTYYTVREYIQAGIAGAHIEDQTFPPKAGPRRRLGLEERGESRGLLQ
jgi:hypothetical protein